MFLGYVDQIERVDNMFYIVFDVVSEHQLKKLLEDPVSAKQINLSDAYSTFCLMLKVHKWSDVPALQREIEIDRWYKIEINDSESNLVNAIRYDDMNSNNGVDVNVQIYFLDKRVNSTKNIYHLFSLNDFPKSNENELTNLLTQNRFASKTFLAVYNVGQGNCSAVCNSLNSSPIVYYDFGGGCYSNAHTYPSGQQYCFTNNPPIVLSHWDNDHWSSANHLRSPWAKNYPWIVPDQPLNATQLKFASELAFLGNLYIWPRISTLKLIRTGYGAFFYCDGTSKNDSGLGFLYSSEQEDIRALLPGDAAYKYINSRFKNDLSSIVASHHGGNRRLDPPPFARSTQSNTNIVYPYGLHNSYGHPGVLRFGEHVHFGWNKDIHTYKGHVGLGISSLPPIGCSTNYCDLRIVQI
ncbi:hypothetical protein MKZ07_14355 [Paenibacillus sp. FSL P4-0338]|uniref:hypothetical protein n=1 Tax=Paenibacillus sp. FSL P4-0338 TaxID=2921635 RepID=UPI0030F95D0F